MTPLDPPTASPDTPAAPDTPATPAGGEPPADVELRLPADTAYVAVLRTTAAALAGRMDLTIDDIEDLKICVGEACALVLPQADPGGDLTTRFWLRPGELRVEVGVASTAPAAVDEDGFGWQVLSTLAVDLHAGASDGRSRLGLTVRALHLGPDA